MAVATPPPPLGAPHGPAIDNKSTVLGDVDRALGFDRPPAVEYILVQPFAVLRLPLLGVGFALNYYGHAVVRYTRPNGEQVVRVRLRVRVRVRKTPMCRSRGWRRRS